MLVFLNDLYRREAALHEVDFEWTGFHWIDCNDADHSVLSFMRKSKSGEEILVVCNFTPIARENYLVGVPDPGFFREILNSDSQEYWGTNVGNHGGVESKPVMVRNWPHSLSLTLPPLAVMYFKREAAAT